MSITMIGLDIAKSVFQLHGIDAGGSVRLKAYPSRRQPPRSPSAAHGRKDRAEADETAHPG
jgi:hypothetical protein